MRKTKKKRFTYLISLVVLFVLLGAIYVGYQLKESEYSNVTDTVKSEKVIKEKVANAKPLNIKEKYKNDDAKVKDSTTKNSQESSSLEEKVSSVIESMTLEEKIGQMLIVGFQTTEADQYIKSMIADYHVGGIILFDRNMQNPSQVANLTNSLQDFASQQEQQIPLSIGVDQEGGQIIRMEEQVSSIPSQQQLGQTGNSEKIYNLAIQTGKELAAMGFNLNFAPVLDLSSEDSRSFGENPELTSKYGNEVIKGLVKGGVTATVKHFPGNGRSNIDPHKETSSVQADQLDLENNDIYPFKKAIKEIDNNQFFVMVTHIKYPTYDKENPASISPIIIQDLLREKLGYKGIVVTDDLEMGAVNKYFTYEDLGYKAVEAGADLLLVCHTYENQQKVFNGILEAVKSGKLSEKRIDEAVQRILTYKFQSIKTTKVEPEVAEQLVGKE